MSNPAKKFGPWQKTTQEHAQTAGNQDKEEKKKKRRRRRQEEEKKKRRRIRQHSRDSLQLHPGKHEMF